MTATSQVAYQSTTSTITIEQTEYDIVMVSFNILEQWLHSAYYAVASLLYELDTVVTTLTFHPFENANVKVAGPNPDCVLAKTSDGTELHVGVIVDGNYRNPWVTGFSTSFLNGRHTFIVPWAVSSGGLVYNFLEWKDEGGVVVSRSPTLTYVLPAGKVFYAIYARPTYTLVVFVWSSSSPQKPLAGASVTLDGSLRGTTDKYGRLDIQNIPAGDHLLVISKAGYKGYGPTTISVKSLRMLYVFLPSAV